MYGLCDNISTICLQSSTSMYSVRISCSAPIALMASCGSCSWLWRFTAQLLAVRFNPESLWLQLFPPWLVSTPAYTAQFVFFIYVFRIFTGNQERLSQTRIKFCIKKNNKHNLLRKNVPIWFLAVTQRTNWSCEVFSLMHVFKRKNCNIYNR
jgi:hypothetical protein